MKQAKQVVCPDCGEAVEGAELNRREFLKSAAAAAAAVATTGTTLWAVPKVTAAPTPTSPPETLVKVLYEKLTDAQKSQICFDWDYKDPQRGLLRTHVSNNWHITKPTIDSEFFTSEQRAIIFDIFKGIFNPDWHARILKQLRDDTNGRPWGAEQNIALFGKPGSGKFMFVMTGRHLTIRCDGDSEEHVALGGPIFHGHQASRVSGLIEKTYHPGNIFWHQAVMANRVYKILDGKQQQRALVARRPAESAVGFRGPDGKFPGLPVAEMSADQKFAVEEVLRCLLAPYRKEDQDEIMECLKKRGGLEACSLAFYKDGDMGDDGEWDNWRLEGPAFVWYFRGEPHVHIWINVADDPSVPLNARG
ncbi:MAG TPA: DUF3500 domain-containing protein [Gemmataceae bacterium]|nr:DUF3500 domain-containing protein [Gemmataceae bacterium]